MIVDDHAAVRAGLWALLDDEPDFEVVAAVDGAEAAMTVAERDPIDVAVVELKVLMPHVPLLMFTNNPGWIVEKEARSAGISAVISKSDSNGLKQLLARAKALLGRDETSAQRAS